MKLSAPLRVTWDWNWPPAVHPGRADRGPGGRRGYAVAEELARSKILLLEIGYPGTEDIRNGLLSGIIEKIPAQISLTLAPRTLKDLGGEVPWQTLGVEEVWVDVTPEGGAGEDGVTVPPLRGDGTVRPGLKFYLTSANRKKAAVLFAEAVEGGTRKFSLPILPLFGRFLPSAVKLMPPWRDLMEFANRIDPLLRRFPDLDLRVHYQALWMILKERGFRADESEAPGHSGCQAAGALAYIDPGGTLYPCAALPVPMGRVDRGMIQSVWRGEEREQLRRAVEGIPPVCEKCTSWRSCRGGCRGWAHYLTGGWGEPGPDCGLETGEQRSLR